ncbi:hypothetical protein EVG20_g4005 [Dentipellis fragilis]|uniref:Uncharacterized protein n=1 Tax=Dentipellis fragilis TaxID=205917 RepID=A0A4Y9YY21_9AGAM|nr:hypothetical protein EVG20_g4005 [Dentipellis fragilis]
MYYTTLSKHQSDYPETARLFFKRYEEQSYQALFFYGFEEGAILCCYIALEKTKDESAKEEEGQAEEI